MFNNLNNNSNTLFPMLQKHQQQNQNGKSNLEISTEKWLSLSDLERSNYLYQQRKNGAYKTSLCRYWKNKNICIYGEQCRFAHGIHELLVLPPKHPKHKTQLCKNYIYDGTCEYGSRCQYIHRDMSAQLLPPSPNTSKISWMSMPPPPLPQTVVNPNNYVPTIPSYSSIAKSGLPIQQPQLQDPTMAGNQYKAATEGNVFTFEDLFAELYRDSIGNHVANSCHNSGTSDDFHLDEYVPRPTPPTFDKRFIH